MPSATRLVSTSSAFTDSAGVIHAVASTETAAAAATVNTATTATTAATAGTAGIIAATTTAAAAAVAVGNTIISIAPAMTVGVGATGDGLGKVDTVYGHSLRAGVHVLTLDRQV